MLSMDKNDFRPLIKHYFLRGKTAKETKEKLDKYYGTNTPSNIGFESFVVAATPLPMKSAAAGRPMRLQRTMSKKYMKWCVDYLEKGKTINSEYYCALLERLKAEIAENGLA